MFFTALADISVRFTPTETSSYELVNYDLTFTDYNSSELVQSKSPHKRNLQGSYAKKLATLSALTTRFYWIYEKKKKKKRLKIEHKILKRQSKYGKVMSFHC
jgi:hypothetical protein